mmetsp:Transcript_26346/g.91632  ORF Transcript_26346/g.91632 Transcript_26346/m.91632 type:complete len:388 (-) Transcript_26346:27-1190(-)
MQWSMRHVSRPRRRLHPDHVRQARLAEGQEASLDGRLVAATLRELAHDLGLAGVEGRPPLRRGHRLLFRRRVPELRLQRLQLLQHVGDRPALVHLLPHGLDQALECLVGGVARLAQLVSGERLRSAVRRTVANKGHPILQVGERAAHMLEALVESDGVDHRIDVARARRRQVLRHAASAKVDHSRAPRVRHRVALPVRRLGHAGIAAHLTKERLGLVAAAVAQRKHIRGAGRARHGRTHGVVVSSVHHVQRFRHHLHLPRLTGVVSEWMRVRLGRRIVRGGGRLQLTVPLWQEVVVPADESAMEQPRDAPEPHPPHVPRCFVFTVSAYRRHASLRRVKARRSFYKPHDGGDASIADEAAASDAEARCDAPHTRLRQITSSRTHPIRR